MTIYRVYPYDDHDVPYLAIEAETPDDAIVKARQECERWVADHLFDDQVSQGIVGGLSVVPPAADMSYKLDGDGLTWFRDGEATHTISSTGVFQISGDRQRRIAPRRQWFWHRHARQRHPKK